jgi:hypothetical protein
MTRISSKSARGEYIVFALEEESEIESIIKNPIRSVEAGGVG